MRSLSDPHFQTWHGVYYDYHGGCDLVLIQNPGFPGGGLDLHIRTVRFGGYSGITNAVLRIGDNILEVVNDGTYFLNGALNSPALGSFPAPLTITGTAYNVDLGTGQSVEINQWGTDLNVIVTGSGKDFEQSVGLCGTWTTPIMLKRDLTDVYPDGNAFGEDWQVQPSDGNYFQATPSPQWPDSCLPALTSGEGGGEFNGDIAAQLCKEVREDRIEQCIFDVVTTQDPTWPNAPFYEAPRDSGGGGGE